MGRKRDVARSPEDLERKRNQILDAAMTLLVEQGFTRTTMSSVAEVAGIGRGTVYWHFPSKDDLFMSLFEREVRTLEDGFTAVLESPLPPLDKLDSIYQLTFAYYREMPTTFQAFLSVLTGASEELEARMLEEFSNIYRKFSAMFEAVLDEGKARGEVRADLDSHVVSAALLVLLDTLYFQIHVGVLDNDPERLANALIPFFHRGYLAPRRDE